MFAPQAISIRAVIVAAPHQVIALKILRDEGEHPSPLTYGTIAELPQFFCPLLMRKVSVVHDPNFYNFSSGRNLCVRSDTGRSSRAIPFSSPRRPAARASFAAIIF